VRRTLAGLAAVLILGGCSQLNANTPDESPTPTPAPTTPSDGAISMAGRAPLTGVPVKEVPKRPALAVKISNTSDAHPQRGLGDADLVFVEPITGSTTRLAAVFQSRMPAQIGPVRSLRPTDAALLGPTRGVVADTMADRWVLTYFDKVTDVDDRGTLVVPPNTYRIDPRRRAPNHVFVQTAKLLTLTKRTAPAPYFSYAPDIAKSSARLGTPATSVRIGYGGPSTATWTYQAKTKRWTRAEQWAPHMVEGGGQVAADNVLVLRAAPDHSFQQARKSMSILDFTDTSGQLQLFTGGKVVTGRWTKAGVNDPFTFTGPDGKRLLLTPGTTWVECALTSMAVQVAR
jgi:hypothetical protein